jgi:signal peptidase I
VIILTEEKNNLDENETKPIQEKRFDLKKELTEWLKIILIMGPILLIIYMYVGSMYKIEGDSMRPTFVGHERVWVNKWPYITLKRGDIVIVDPHNVPVSSAVNQEMKRGTWIKRVVGLPGETIEIKNGDVYINDHKLKESYTKEKSLRDLKKIVIPADSFFVMGDNRNGSTDSRDVGVFERSNILGRATRVLWRNLSFENEERAKEESLFREGS